MKMLSLIVISTILDITFSDNTDYSRWANAMKGHGFGWEPVIVETDDGY